MQTMEDFVESLAAAAQELDVGAHALRDHLNAIGIGEAEKRQLEGEVERIETARRDLDAELLAFRAGQLTLPLPPAEALGELDTALDALQREIGARARADLLLGFCRGVVVAVATARGHKAV